MEMEDAVRQAVGETSPGEPATPRVRRQRNRTVGGTQTQGGGTAAPNPSGASGGAAPPPRQSGPASPRSRATGPQFKAQLEQYFATVALVPATFGDTYSAQIITSRAGYLAEQYSELAKQSPAVKKVLEGLMSGGAWGGAVVATLSIIIPIAGHYGLFPTVDPWENIYPVNAQQGRKVYQMPPASPEETPGVVTVSPDLAAAMAGTYDFQEPVDRVANSGPGTEPSDFTPPVAPGQPAGVVTVAGVEAVRNSVTQGVNGSAAPQGTTDNPPQRQQPNRVTDIPGSAAPQGTTTNPPKPRKARNRAGK